MCLVECCSNIIEWMFARKYEEVVTSSTSSNQEEVRIFERDVNPLESMQVDECEIILNEIVSQISERENKKTQNSY